MKIALVGYGKMGQEVEKLVKETSKDQIVSISRRKKLDIEGIKKADVVLDFTNAEVLLPNLKKIASLKKNIVIGTTGWYVKLKEVENIVRKNKIGVVYGQNFSVGANIFFKISALASKLFSKSKAGYDVYGLEIHHREKKDSPSGTAKKLAEVVMNNFSGKNIFQNSPLNRKIKSGELHFASIRGGFNPGFHELVFDSLADEIKISHSARGRRGFAQGAIAAAYFIKGKKGFYTFDDVLKN